MKKPLQQITFDFTEVSKTNATTGLNTHSESRIPKEKSLNGSGRGRKSLRDAAREAELVQIPNDEELFSRQYYSIGEVAKMFRVKPSLLRFWENEFDVLKPRKNKKGDRHFRPQDVKNLLLIHDLIRKRKFTIEGAREWLKNSQKADEKFEALQSLQKIRAFLLEIKANL